MEKLFFLFFAFWFTFAVKAQDIPADVQRIYDKIVDNKAELDDILSQDEDQATIKNDVEYFQYRMKTLQNYMNGITKRYADESYSTADLEMKHENFKSYYQSKLAGFSDVKEPVPSDILGYYSKLNTHKDDLQKLVSGNYERFMVEKMLLSFESKELPKLENGLNTLKERYSGQSYIQEIQENYNGFITYFENFKSSFKNGEVDIEANSQALKDINEVKNQLMMFSQKWDYREEMLQANELANFVFNLVEPYDWNNMPNRIESEAVLNTDAMNAKKYLTTLISAINNETHFTNCMVDFIDYAIKVRYNVGYPNKEYTDKANTIAEHVKKSADFAEKIGGSANNIAVIRAKVNAYYSSTPKATTASKQVYTLPAAGMTDSNVERELVDYFNTLGWQEKFFSTVITNYEWNYQKSTAGIIIARTLGVAMVSKKSIGTCMFQHFTIIQDKTPSGFGNSKKYSVGEQKACQCN